MRAPLLLGLLISSFAHAFTVEFSPQGEQKNLRQVRAVFSEPIVAFGDPNAQSPFAVDCSAKGKGAWEDTRTWLYEFPAELTAGESCRFEGRAELKSQKNSGWTGPRSFQISTGGPAVVRSTPWDGSQVEESQAFLLSLDGAVDPASVEKSAYFLVEGLPERIPVKLLSEAVKAEMEKTRYNYEEEEGGAPATKPITIALQPARPLPAEKKIQLVWGKGIRSPKGSVTAQDQYLAFRTREPFRARFSCQRENAEAPCLPIGTWSLDFNGSIPKTVAEKVQLRAGNRVIKPKLNDEDGDVGYLRFEGPFPPAAELTLELPAGIKDDAGRALTNAGSFPLKVKSAAYPPLAKFAAPFGILEAKDPVLPVTLRQVEEGLSASRVDGRKVKLGWENPVELLRWLNRIRSRHDNYYKYENNVQRDLRGESLLSGLGGGQKFQLPRTQGPEAFEVVGIPLGEKGFHLVELESQLLGKSLLGKPAPMFVAAAALVTDLGVHFKRGKEGSLVWVTELSSAKPVKGADVRVLDCEGTQLWKGSTNGEGVAEPEKLPSFRATKHCDGVGSGLTVFAKKGDDFSFVSTEWDDGIEPWRFQVNYQPEADETYAHTVFDRTLFRAGQTVHMKHFLRAAFLRGLRAAAAQPKYLVLNHASGQRFVFPVKFNEQGSAESEWKIPEGAKLGTYEVYLTAKEVKARNDGEDDGFSFWGEGIYRAGDFRVEEFRLPVVTGALQFAAGPFVAPKELTADLSVRYLNGGGASGLKTTFRARAEKSSGAAVPGFEGFSFANGAPELGRVKRENAAKPVNLTVPPATLDGGGAARVSVKGLPQWKQPYDLTLEAEYRDPNGEIQTLSRRTKVFPSAAVVGVKPAGWANNKESVKFQVAVVSPAGKPLAGRHVAVSWIERKSYSHRKRIVGGFYAYESFEEVKALGPACSGETDAKGVLACDGKAPASGNLGIVAETEIEGRKSYAHAEIWVASGDDWWFPAENNDRMDVLAEQKRYEPGENARLQLRMPFREATALVTVEREGILEHFVREVSAKEPVVEVPVKPEYAPNVFVSVFVVRGRVGEPQATALVDLAKPSHKLGIAELDVNWRAHELKVDVATDRDEFRVREKAKVKVKVARASDGKPAKEGEVLLLAVDEALLEIRPNESWKLLDAMMGARPLRVQTSTAQSQVVGKRHFGLKALPAGGGGGGVAAARELFDTLLFWNATLPLDRNGEAVAEVPMNDSLSSFRIVAIATDGIDRFGTGAKSVRTRQDLMLFAGVAPLAREGDRTRPEITVRNGSDQALTAEVKARVVGAAEWKAQTVSLEPGSSKVLRWDYAVPVGAGKLDYEFEASAGAFHDKVRFSQKVVPPYRDTVIQATLERLEKPFSFEARPAANAFPNTAAVGVRLERTLGSNLGAVKEYMRAYPFTCLEQQTSKLVALQDEKAWAALAKAMPQYVDGNGLLKYFPEVAYGSDVLTTYVLSVTEAVGFRFPESLLPKVLEGLKNFVQGRVYEAGFVYPAADLALRKLSAMEVLSRYSVFDPAWLSTIQVEPDLLPLAGLIDYRNLLRRELKVPQREAKLAKVNQAIRARLEWRGTILGFRGEERERLWWLMGSADREANRLLASVVDDPAWKSDIGRLVRGVLARQKQGVWDLTTANAWGTVAFTRYSNAFEKEPVSGVTKVQAGSEQRELSWAGEAKPAATFPLKAATKVEVKHEGAGQPWAFLFAKAALNLKEPVAKGYRYKRSVQPVQQKVKGRWSVGDIYRVTLEVEGTADMTWVVVSDPIPGGATLLGSGLSKEPTLAGTDDRKGAWPTYEERSFEGFRAYYEWMPKGVTTVQYTVRLNTAGRFQLPNTRVEAMYAPEMHAEGGNGAVDVAE